VIQNDTTHADRLTPFIERLLVLPLAEWHECAAKSPAQIARELENKLASALLMSATSFEIWRAGDNVETALFRFDGAEGRRLTRRAGTLVHIRVVTTRAALGVLASPALETSELRALCAGFYRLIM
jgi:hypothetical protein